MEWYLEVLKKYAVFSGRARRKEYWFFTLFNFIFSLALTFVDIWLGLANKSGWGPLSGLYTLALFIPGLAVTVRRLHDTGNSGWWILISLVPCVGWLVLLIYLIQDSQPGENQYGPNPIEDLQWPPDPPNFSTTPR
jgi:uncharacterized membrane protein YhaH (DUF805 family)